MYSLFTHCDAKPLDSIVTSHIASHDAPEKGNMGDGPLHITQIHEIKLNHA